MKKLFSLSLWIVLSVLAVQAHSDAAADLDKQLSALKNYQYGQVLTEVQQLTEYVISVSGDPQQAAKAEKTFISFLESNPSLDAKQLVCRQLRVIGSGACVPVVSKMLMDEKTSDMARYALEANMDPAAEKALLLALDSSKGKNKIGMIKSLKARRSAASIASLSGLILDQDKDVAYAAIEALGEIGGAQSLSALNEAMKKTTGQDREQVMLAMIQCADRMAAGNDRDPALGVYRQLIESQYPANVRMAAYMGLAAIAQDQESIDALTEKIVVLLNSSDNQENEIGTALVRKLSQGQAVAAIVKGLPAYSPYVQELVVYALADRGDKDMLDAVKGLLASENENVRIAVIRALAKIGDADSVKLLADRAVSGSGDEKKSAEESLQVMKGKDVDAKLIELVPQAESKTKIILIGVIGDRFIKDARSMLIEIAKSQDAESSIAAAKALSKVVDSSDSAGLIDIMLTADSADLRGKIEPTLVSSVSRINDESQRAKIVLDARQKADSKEKKLSFIRALGQIGGAESTKAALEIVQKGDDDERLAAAEGLSKGRVFEAVPALVDLVKRETNLKRHVLAIRYTLDILNDNQIERRSDDGVAFLSSLLSYAMRNQEREQILASLTLDRNRCAMGYVVAKAWMTYPELKAAAEPVVKRLRDDHHGEVSDLPHWGEYKGLYNGKQAMGMVVSQKHKDRDFNYRIRIVGEGVDTSFEGRPDRERVLIDNDGWKGEIRSGKLKAAKEGRVVEMEYYERKSPTLGQQPPQNAIVLLPFEQGKAATVDQWDNPNWKISADGSIEVGSGYNKTKREFGSCQLHVEFALPFMPEEFGQGRGNSGVYLMGRYEVQVLDSFGDNPDRGNCGGIYDNAVPRVPHLELPPLQWQTYDITFRAPEFDAAGNVTKPACLVKVVHNGVVIHENIQVLKPTPASVFSDQKATGPLALQDHENPVRFRNIWIVP